MEVELPLVVAEFPDRRQQRLLGVCVLHLVLHLPLAHHRVCLEPALLQLQLPCLCRVRAINRDGRISDGVCVYPTHLQVSILLQK